jgi:hypothetical protein
MTHADLHYEGSLSIDRTLMEAADIAAFEEVHVWNITRGTRLTTYAIEAPHAAGSSAPMAPPPIASRSATSSLSRRFSWWHVPRTRERRLSSTLMSTIALWPSAQKWQAQHHRQILLAVGKG